jgi:hypothetical protein
MLQKQCFANILSQKNFWSWKIVIENHPKIKFYRHKFIQLFIHSRLGLKLILTPHQVKHLFAITCSDKCKGHGGGSTAAVRISLFLGV